MPDAAAEGLVSVATAYRYFTSAEDLWAEASWQAVEIDGWLDEVERQIEAAGDDVIGFPGWPGRRREEARGAAPPADGQTKGEKRGWPLPPPQTPGGQPVVPARRTRPKNPPPEAFAGHPPPDEGYERFRRLAPGSGPAPNPAPPDPPHHPPAHPPVAPLRAPPAGCRPAARPGPPPAAAPPTPRAPGPGDLTGDR